MNKHDYSSSARPATAMDGNKADSVEPLYAVFLQGMKCWVRQCRPSDHAPLMTDGRMLITDDLNDSTYRPVC